MAQARRLSARQHSRLRPIVVVIINTPQRVPFPDITALALQSRPYKGTKKTGANTVVTASFVADWRAENERF